MFYVGKGRDRRAWSEAGRSKAWKEVSMRGYSVELYQQGLCEKAALELETQLIKNTQQLVNKLLLSPVKFDDFAEHFSYDPTSPSGLTRIKRVRGGKLGPCGSKLTRSCGGQHWIVGFKRRTAQVHRIVWQICNGEIPMDFVIDHIDGDSLNNKIENLRIISQEENSRNLKRNKFNVSGVTGVHLWVDNRRQSSSAWCACYNDMSGKLVKKSFSVSKFGNDIAFKLACDYRERMLQEMNILGAGYTTRHGT